VAYHADRKAFERVFGSDVELSARTIKDVFRKLMRK